MSAKDPAAARSEPLVAWARACATAPAGDGVLLVREPRRGRYLALNPAAAAVLQGLRDGSRAAALRRLLDRDVPEPTAGEWLDATLAAWRGEGLGPGAARPAPGPAAEPAGVAPAMDAVYRLGDAAVRLRCFEPRLARLLAALAEPALAAGDDEPSATLSVVHEAGGAFRLLRDRGAVLDACPDALAAKWAVMRALVALGRPARRWAALLHAGAVADDRGRAALLAGVSGSGKSTLTAGLVASGLALLADDLAPLDEGAWEAWSVPLAMSVKEGSWPVVGRLFPGLADRPVVDAGRVPGRYLWPGEGAAADPRRGHRVAALVFPTYEAGAPLGLRPLRALEAVGLLGAAGSTLPETEEGLRALLAWAEATPAYRLVHGDLGAAVARVRSLLADEPVA